MASRDYHVTLLHEPTGAIDHDNVDVLVDFSDGRRCTATFFTLDNIRFLMNRYQTTGENSSGAYFWASDAIIVDVLNEPTIMRVIHHLVETGEYRSAMTEYQASRIDGSDEVHYERTQVRPEVE